ncbi:hypothetical protein [Nannocystis sp.]|uniref:hypothetical protein n=1 Tax=Nannocystis sp. TaxID=1962667 RepID=UPI0025D3A9E8|nr:hypothetical protein [Nannocystis sp.]MBK7823695.1 hypothetical protein [Nannocystis sp.]
MNTAQDVRSEHSPTLRLAAPRPARTPQLAAVAATSLGGAEARVTPAVVELPMVGPPVLPGSVVPVEPIVFAGSVVPFVPVGSVVPIAPVESV